MKALICLVIVTVISLASVAEARDDIAFMVKSGEVMIIDNQIASHEVLIEGEASGASTCGHISIFSNQSGLVVKRYITSKKQFYIDGAYRADSTSRLGIIKITTLCTRVGMLVNITFRRKLSKSLPFARMQEYK